MSVRYFTPQDFNCIQCGKCCRRLNIERIFIAEDIRRWRREKRLDILNYCRVMEYQDDIDLIDFFNPETNSYINSNCPFLVKRLGKYWCGIHETKPWTCENWPFTPANAIDPEKPMHIDALYFYKEFPFCKAFERK